jgi:hypothetical protein
MATTNNYYKIKHGLEAPSQDAIQVTESTRPTIRPSLSLDFANSKVLDPRITFARASDATYYDGKTTAKAEENLLTYSQEFDNDAWNKSRSAVTANTTIAPDGTTTADTLVCNTDSANGFSLIKTLTRASDTAYTLSVYLKKGTNDFAQLLLTDAGKEYRQWFNLSTGVLGISTSNTWTGSGSIIDVGNGWYRCSIAANTTTGTSVLAFIAPCLLSEASYTCTIGEEGYLWGAQLEQRDSVTAYTPTTTQPITNYIPVLQTATNDVARFDHNPVTSESLGLLIEEQRTNLVLQSEEFDNAAWAKTNTTISPNTIVAPDSTLSMHKLVLNSGSTSGSVRQSVTGAPAFTNNAASINLSTNAVTIITGFSSGVTVENVGNGVVRISATVSGYTGSVYAKKGEWEFLQLQIFNISSIGVLYIYPVQSLAGSTGDGYSGIYIWGAQLEAGAFPTSYIPTVASQVTRVSDSASMTGANFSSWYRADEGSIYVEAATSVFDIGRTIIEINDGTQPNRLYLGRNSSTTSGIGTIIAGGATQANTPVSNTFVSGISGKLAMSFIVNQVNVSGNGTLGNPDASAILPVVNRARIGATFAGATMWNGTIKKLSYYPQRLTNEQLQGLTSS